MTYHIIPALKYFVIILNMDNGDFDIKVGPLHYGFSNNISMCVTILLCNYFIQVHISYHARFEIHRMLK